MNVKNMFSAISATLALCCGVFVGAALAQSDDLWGDYNSSSPMEMSMPESEDPPPGWEPLHTTEETPAKNKSAKAAKPAKAAKTPKAAKAPKPAKDTKPKAAAASAGAGDDKTLNIFANTGAGFGIGGLLIGEVPTPNTNDSKGYYMNMGQGLRLEAGAGYMAMPNLETRFSVDLNFGLFAPNNIELTLPNGTSSTDYSYFSWGVKMMAVPQFEALEMLDMYIGAGLSFNFAYATETLHEETRTNNVNTRDIVYDMGFFWPAVGLCGVIGFTLPLSEMMDFFGELQFESKSFTLVERRVADYKNSQDPSNQYKPGNNSYSTGKLNSASPLFSGSTWGIRVGLKYWISL